MNRIRLVLFDMNNRIFGPYFAAIDRNFILVTPGETGSETGGCSCRTPPQQLEHASLVPIDLTDGQMDIHKDGQLVIQKTIGCLAPHFL
jgi:hypothetical protein